MSLGACILATAFERYDHGFTALVVKDILPRAQAVARRLGLERSGLAAFVRAGVRAQSRIAPPCSCIRVRHERKTQGVPGEPLQRRFAQLVEEAALKV